MTRAELIHRRREAQDIARDLRGKAGVSVAHAHVRKLTMDLLRAELDRLPVLVLKPEWRVRNRQNAWEMP